MNSIINKQKINFLLISFGSFVGSIIVLNIINFFTDNPNLSSKITVILIFFYNFYFLKKTFKVKDDKSLFFTLLILSIIFRFFELWFFLYLLNQLNNINYAWSASIITSFIIKYFLYPFVINLIKKKWKNYWYSSLAIMKRRI